MATEQAKQIRKRGVIRGQITTSLKKIETLLQSVPVDRDELEEGLNVILRKEAALRPLDDIVQTHITDPDQMEDDVEQCEKIYDDISVCKTKCSRKIREIDATLATGGASGSSTPSTLSSSGRSNGSSVKLPKLELAKFDGDMTKWPNFWNQFSSTVHQNVDLDGTKKFTYLKTCLEGLAATAIKGLTVSDANYIAAIDILERRFGRRDQTVNTHLDNLATIDPVTRTSDTAALRRLYDSLTVEMRSLSALGISEDRYGILLCTILLKRIPKDINLEFSKKQDGQREYDITELVQFLGDEVSSRERAFTMSEPVRVATAGGKEPNWKTWEERKPKPKGFQQRSGGSTSSAMALHTGVAPSSKGCLFCSDIGHFSGECDKISVPRKREIVREKDLCFVCLKSGHSSKSCFKRNKVCKHCGYKHHSSICETQHKKDEGADSTEITACHLSTKGDKISLLETAQVDLSNGGNGISLRVRCLMDGGSQRTFIKTEVSRQLNLPVVGEEKLRVVTFNSDNAKEETRRRVRLTLTNVRDPSKKIELEALESPSISCSRICVSQKEAIVNLQNKGFQLADNMNDNSSGELQLLIGADYYWMIVTGKIERLGPALVALDTLFGWTISGPTDTSEVIGAHTVAVSKVLVYNTEAKISDQVEKFWSLDAMGIQDSGIKEDVTGMKVLENFESSISFRDGRYEVCLPWKPNRENLGDNYKGARKRAQGLARKFVANPSFFMKYREIIHDQEKRGVIEKVEAMDQVVTGNPRYYLPHHGVIREDKQTTPLRVVYDGSAHDPGSSSLNECLEIGPNLNPDILEVLLRFRTFKIAFVADIEKAFLQISLTPTDRDAVRFLWPENPSKPNELTEYRITRVPFGVASSPFLLTATIRHHLKQNEEKYPEVCELIRSGLYYDDLASGSSEVSEGIASATEAKELILGAGMNLRKWLSNSRELQETMNGKSSLAGESVNFSLDSSQGPNVSQKVLGLAWNNSEDHFSFDLKGLLQFLTTRVNTKRFILQCVARIFDPIGFLAPFVIRMKVLFQSLWRSGAKWDTKLGFEITDEFDRWCEELPQLHQLKIPRHYYDGISEDEIESRQLIVFCDASKQAYAAVAYIRYIRTDGTIGVNFVSAKSRVAPINEMTIARLELMGALLGARLLNYLKPIFTEKLSDIRLFTDNTAALYWIRGSPSRWKPFVANRVTEIQGLTEPRIWSHVRGPENPADLATRGKSVDQLIECELWWSGPEWLRLDETKWPSTSGAEPVQEDLEVEQRVKFKESLQCSCIVNAGSEPLLDVGKYSSLSKVKRIMSYVIRFTENCRKHKNLQQRGALTTEEILQAEKVLIREAQSRDFREEKTRLQLKERVSPQSNISNLNPIMDEDGIMRVGGRLEKTGLTFGEKHPIILNSKNKLSELIAGFHHARLMHSGLRDTITEIRERFWIIRGRQMVKKLIGSCVTCKRFSVKPGAAVVAPLPSDRINEAPPFKIVGIDFAGPVIVRVGKRGTQKAYIALFTCGVTRAVHLELVSDQSTDSFLMSFRRFISRRGVPSTIYSDNARTFQRANFDLIDIWDHIKSNKFLEFLVSQEINWKFIVERAAWWGGFYERLVKSTKLALKKVLGRSLLNYEEFETTLIEVEAILNSRPLTYVYNEVNEPAPLTPGHFLVGDRVTALPSRTFSKTDRVNANREEITRRWRYRQNLLDQCWVRWRSDYLMELSTAHKYVQPKRETEFKRQDLVLVHDEKHPRTIWKMGVIEELFKGRDDKVRSCLVKLGTGKSLRRPVQLLYPLEIV